MNDLVGKFTRSEFFSVLPPGFYVFVAAYCVVTRDAGGESPKSLWGVIRSLAEQLSELPVLLMFVLFASYLIGSVFRALPVSWIERTIPPFRLTFPDRNILRKALKEMDNHGCVNRGIKVLLRRQIESPSQQVLNYWKDALCIESPSAFALYRTVETRVRLFAGILLAAWAGVIGGLTLVVQSFLFDPVGTTILGMSVLLLLSFGGNFRRLRRQETETLVLLYCALLQNGGLTGRPRAAKPSAPAHARRKG